MYRSDVAEAALVPEAGTVAVLDPKGRFLGTALSSSQSEIPLRLISRETVVPDAAFFQARIERAWHFRQRTVRDTEAFRAVFSEGDQLPGLIVDQYGPVTVAQMLTQAMARHRGLILDALRAVIAPAGIVLRNDAPVRKKEGLPVEVETLGTVPDSVELRLNGLAWAVDLRLGQKTGLFLDQRENYRAAAAHARGWAFDGFTSSGGFALSLAAVCDSVEAVDASEAALGRARGNAARNGIANIQFRAADVFDVLAQKASAGTRYDTIVLDPPAFAKSKSAIDKALSGYREINTKALRMLDPGGILVTCSCSRHVGESEFLGMLAQAARDAGRTLRIRERRTQSADHPILLTVPETQYLKCVIAEVI